MSNEDIFLAIAFGIAVLYASWKESIRQAEQRGAWAQIRAQRREDERVWAEERDARLARGDDEEDEDDDYDE